MSKVALVKCGSYDEIEVKKSLKKGLDLLGGINKFVEKDQKVLLKLNLLTGDVPEKCTTTNPIIFKALSELLLSAGAIVSYGDSPAMGNTEAVARKVGFFQIAEDLKIKLADFLNGKEVFFDKGKQNKKFFIANAVFDNDVIISLPKFKTHGLTKFTGAVKNQFGCIPGLRKGEFHVRIPDHESFAKMLVDLNTFVNPKLYIMDGIMAMEGNGPRGGTPKKMGLLLLSTDPIALDATACRLINLNPEYVPTITQGMKFGAGTYLEKDIQIVGDNFDEFVCPDFIVDRKPLKLYKKKGFLSLLNNLLVPKPYIQEEKCVKCGLCVNVCPVKPKALNWDKDNKQRPPKYNYNYCIRCYCCQELCPHSVIKLKKPFLRRLFG